MNFKIGQSVGWKHSPSGIAQIDRVMRRRIRLVYATKRGTLRFPVVHPEQLAKHQPTLPIIFNPMNRGIPYDRTRTPVVETREGAMSYLESDTIER